MALPSTIFGQTVTDATGLQTTLNTSSTPGTVDQTITFGNSISIAGYSTPGYNAGSGFLGAINAPVNGAVLTIDGNGNSLTGGSNALFLASPENEMASGGVSNPTAQKVTIQNLTISGATSQGGNVAYGGGGAALGGGLFVGTGVNIILNTVNFQGNQAIGGSSTFGSASLFGGGGIGGIPSYGGGGGLYANAPDSFSGGGANGGQGLSGDSGGFGGGGAEIGGMGGFAAGGAETGQGGFGGGAGYLGTAGFGGGADYNSNSLDFGGIGGGSYSNGGGAGFGGAIFVQNGASLTLTGNDTLAGDTAIGGAGTHAGAGVGNEIFMMTGSSVTLAPGTDNTITIGAVGDTGNDIADDSASSLPAGQSYLQGTAAGAGLVLGSADNPGGTVYLYGNNTYQGGTTLQDGVTLVVGSSHALGTGTITMMDPTMVYMNGDDIANAMVLMGDTTLEVDSTDSATQSGAISESGGSFGITKTGTGTLTLSGSNTYTGATIVDFGTLTISGTAAAITQTSSVSVGHDSGDDGTLTVTGTGSSLTSTGLITVGDQGTGSLTVENGGTVTTGLNGINNVGFLVSSGVVTGTVTVTGMGSSLTVASDGTGDMVLGNAGTASLTISNHGLVTDNSAFLGEGSTTAIATVDVTGTGSTWTNSGIITIGEAGSGTVTIEDNGSVSASFIVIADQTPAVGLLKIGNNNAVGSLTIDSIQFGSGTGTLEFDQTNTATLNADISGAGTVNIEGSGTTILGGNSTYTGTTTISAGTVEVGSAMALGASDVVLNSGTLTTTGTGTGVQVNIGGNYTQAAGSTLLLNLYSASNHDSLHLTSPGGVATVNGTLMLNLVGGFAPGLGQSIAVITTSNPIVGQFTTISTNLPSIGATADYTDNVTVIFQNGFATLTGIRLTPNQLSVATYIDQHDMTSTSPAFNSVVAALNSLSGDPNALAAAFSQLTPQAFGQFSTTTAFNNASFETEAMDNYLANQRGADGNFLAGNDGVDASGLVVNDPSYDPNLAMIHSRMLAWNPAPAHGVVSDVAGPALGGVDMQPGVNPSSLAPQNGGRPWNAFVRGNVVLAQGSSSQDVPHFDDNTESVVIGADYRITPHFLVGLTGSYGHTDATLDNNGTSATVDSYSPGLYASYADKGWYANLSGNYVFNNYTQDRVIGFLGQTAHSAPQGNEGVANLDGGYDFHRGAWTFGPLAGLQYTHLSVNGYNESGSAADLSVNEQDADSLRSRLGGRVSFAFVGDGIHFAPRLDVSWQHEFMDQSRGITSQLDGAGLGSFNVQTDQPSRDSALIDLGIDADLNGIVTVFGDYEVQAGQENYFGQSIQGGVKVGF